MVYSNMFNTFSYYIFMGRKKVGGYMKLPVNYDNTPFKERRLVREEYIKIQKNLCCHCGELLNKQPHLSIRKRFINRKLFPKNFFKHLIHLHHSHDTGLTIGAVHSYCNAVLWQYHGE